MPEAEVETSPVIRKYQQRCFRDYARSVGLPELYTYPAGNPIRPLPPAQTKLGGLMIVGAYPSARFESRPSTRDSNKRRLVPVADNLHPFAEEMYFDGRQVRRLTSGDQLREHLLGPLNLDAHDCWITDLVKVFLYKPKHVDSCGDACPDFNVPMFRTGFSRLAIASLRWLREECDLCVPKLVVTLGEEVAQVVAGQSRATADDLLNRPICHPESLGGHPILFLPHPDACRRSAKWRNQIKDRITMIRAALAKEVA